MTRFPQDDDKLVKFLRRYRPLPPPARVNLERQLLQAIASQTRPRQQVRPAYLFWTLASACLGGLLLAWGGNRWFSPQPFPQVTASSEDLEVFLMESWQGALGETALSWPNPSLEADWLLLANLETNPSH